MHMRENRLPTDPICRGWLSKPLACFFWVAKWLQILGVGNWIPTSHHPGLRLSQVWSWAGHFLGYHAVPIFKIFACMKAFLRTADLMIVSIPSWFHRSSSAYHWSLEVGLTQILVVCTPGDYCTYIIWLHIALRSRQKATHFGKLEFHAGHRAEGGESDGDASDRDMSAVVQVS